MAIYPNGIYEGRVVENLPDISYNEDDKKTIYAEDLNGANAEIQAIEQTLGVQPMGEAETVAARLAELESQLQSVIEDIPLQIAQAKSEQMPVGTIYGNGALTADPAQLLGFGEWEPYARGRTIVGLATSGTFGGIGGEMGSERHTLTVAEIPKHRHPLEYGTNTGAAGQRVTVAAGNGPFNSTNPILDTGGGGSHNNIQPSKVAALWIRVA